MIQLEQFGKDDYATLISWVDNAAALMQFAGPAFVFPLTEEQLNVSLADPCRYAFKVMADKIMIGHAELYTTAQSVYLGRILIGDPQIRGQGIGRQIVTLLLSYAFTKLDKPVAQLNVFDWNKAAIRCYENAGFTINREQRVERIVDGQTWVALNMVLSKTDWLQSI